MNKNELINLRNGWLQQASRDLSSRLIDFMETNRLNEANLADILALDVNSVRNMLNGAQNVTLLEFATLLIATGNVLRIEPISASPFANGRVSNGGNVRGGVSSSRNSRNTQRNQPKRDANGRFMPRSAVQPIGCGFPMPPMGGMPMGNLSEQFGGMPGIQNVSDKHDDTERVTDVDWDDLSKSEIANIIHQNHWDGEIDLNRANRSQMIAFLESKEASKQHNVSESNMPNEVPMNDGMEGSVSQMAQAIAAQLASNPQMLQQLIQTMQPQR